MRKSTGWTICMVFSFLMLSCAAPAMAGQSGDSPGMMDTIKTKSMQVWRKIEKVIKDSQRYCEKLTDKYVQKVKPLDRSRANAKSDSLAKAMDEAGQAASALSKKNLTINSEIKRQSGAWGSNEHKDSDSKKGRFSSLD